MTSSANALFNPLKKKIIEDVLCARGNYTAGFHCKNKLKGEESKKSNKNREKGKRENRRRRRRRKTRKQGASGDYVGESALRTRTCATRQLPPLPPHTRELIKRIKRISAPFSQQNNKTRKNRTEKAKATKHKCIDIVYGYMCVHV